MPVEVGESYLAANYVEERMSFGKYLSWYVLPESTEKKGYLAQHQLLDQIPALREDIVVPEYCYTAPPLPRPYSAAAMTPGYADAPIDLEEPLMNVWLGPKGTKVGPMPEAVHRGYELTLLDPTAHRPLPQHPSTSSRLQIHPSLRSRPTPPSLSRHRQFPWL